MATITVTNNNDSGTGSLRDALANSADGDTIVFDPSVAGESIQLGSTLNVSTAVTIDGGNQNITIDGQHQYTDFNVSTTNYGVTSINNLIIENGQGAGSSVPVPVNANGGNAGGGIYTSTDLNLSNDIFLNNSATGGDGTPAGTSPLNGQDKAAGNGGNAAGAVYVDDGANVTASDLTFSGNTATPGQGGTADSANGAGTPGMASNNSNDANVNAAAVCYVAGTLIRTAHGDIAVEHLEKGDLAVTASGAQRPIRWLGSRLTPCRNHPRPHEVMPIRISAHAFGDNRPARDLFVSPGHSICVDVLGEVLIPASALVNGSTVQQVEVDEVTYWHVELDSHDVILAENLPAESYLDMGNRGFFKEADVVDLAVGPDAEPAQRTHADFCRPFVDRGPILDAVKAQLRRRAESLGWSQSDALEMHLVVDGQRLDPVVRGLTARFEVPAEAKDVWLEAPTARPCDVSESGDGRDLGLYIKALRIDDGFEVRDVAIDDPLLCIGFHPVEEGSMRWTAGRARLPAVLWKGYADSFFLRVELAAAPVPRWVAPAVEERPRLAIVA